MSDATELWNFSLTVYARAGVAAQCLRLQDEWNININMLLWALWLERRGVALNKELMIRAERALADWERDLLQPLRQLRRQLRAQFDFDEATVADCYEQLKSAELQAERVEQHRLAALCTPPVSAPPLTPGSNVHCYLRYFGVPAAEQQRFMQQLES